MKVFLKKNSHLQVVGVAFTKNHSQPICPFRSASSALPQGPSLSQPSKSFDLRAHCDGQVFSSQNFPELPAIEVIVKLRSPTLKFVPKRIRSEWSRAWTETVQDCLYLNDTPSYTFLFLLPKVCLRVPTSNIRSSRAKEDFSLQLLKRWS